MPTLTQVSTEHRQRLMPHVDRLPGLADSITTLPWVELAPQVAVEHAFFVEVLVPHMEAVEKGVHVELDRLLSCQLAMEPMEREHAEVRRLVDRLGDFGRKAILSEGEAIELNRVLVKLYSLLKVHLREESLYVPILERNLTTERCEALVVSMDHARRVEL